MNPEIEFLRKLYRGCEFLESEDIKNILYDRIKQIEWEYSQKTSKENNNHRTMKEVACELNSGIEARSRIKSFPPESGDSFKNEEANK